MAATRRAYANLPFVLRTFLSSTTEFEEAKKYLFLFFLKIKNDLSNKSKPEEAARAFVILEHIKSELETFSKTLSPIHVEHKTKTLPKLFTDIGIPALPLDEGFVVAVKPKFYCSIKPNCKEAAFDWLEANNLGDIIQPHVNPKTLISSIQELIETEGTEPPKECFTSFVQEEAKCTKGRASKKTIGKDEDIFGDVSDED